MSIVMISVVMQRASILCVVAPKTNLHVVNILLQVRPQLRLLHVHPDPVLALQPRIQAPPLLRRQALPRLVAPQHVGGPHDRLEGRPRRNLLDG